MNNFALLQFSDTHILVDTHQMEVKKRDPLQNLRNAIDHALNLNLPFKGALISGDMANKGDIAEYHALKNCLKRIAARMPLYFCLGNHDSREEFRSIFGSFWNQFVDQDFEFLQYQATLAQGHRLVVLDTLCTGYDFGQLCDRRLSWLDKTLELSKDTQVILAMHHPPFVHGNPLFDAMAIAERTKLEVVIEKHPHVQLIVCGHLHQTTIAKIAHCSVISAPSTYHAYGFNFDENNRQGISEQAPGYMVHHWHDSLACVSHAILLKDF